MVSPLSFSTELARQVGETLLGYYHRANLQSHLKSDRTIVTEADTLADGMIAAAIRQQFPGETLLSEELQPELEGHPESTPPAAWIVDPIDGTTNFSLGMPIWGVLITRLLHGWPDTAVLYFPVIAELYCAQRGQGAFLNGHPIRPCPPSASRPTTFFTCCSRTYRRYQVSVPYKARILGCAAYSFCSVGRGMAVLGFEAAPKIWDIAAGWLLVQEAGGVVETLDGSQPFPLQPGLAYSQQGYPTLIAPNAEVAARAREQILPRGPVSATPA